MQETQHMALGYPHVYLDASAAVRMATTSRYTCTARGRKKSPGRPCPSCTSGLLSTYLISCVHQPSSERVTGARVWPRKKSLLPMWGLLPCCVLCGIICSHLLVLVDDVGDGLRHHVEDGVQDVR